MARAAPALFAAALLSGCLGRGQDAGGEVRSMTLSYPHQVEAAFLFDGYQALAGEAAASYTRVVIIDPDTSAEDGRGPGGRAVVNAASGVIVHPAGYVVTAAHIALDPRFVADVITFDGRTHAAEILRVDRARELALLRMSPFPGMRVARLGDSDLVQEGELVLAIADPAGFANHASLRLCVFFVGRCDVHQNLLKSIYQRSKTRKGRAITATR